MVVRMRPFAKTPFKVVHKWRGKWCMRRCEGCTLASNSQHHQHRMSIWAPHYIILLHNRYGVTLTHTHTPCTTFHMKMCISRCAYGKWIEQTKNSEVQRVEKSEFSFDFLSLDLNIQILFVWCVHLICRAQKRVCCLFGQSGISATLTALNTHTHTKKNERTNYVIHLRIVFFFHIF